jgi:hypothetical protein
VIIDDKTFLFESSRRAQGKAFLVASEVGRNGSKGFQCTNTSFVGTNYNGMLSMVKDLVPAKSMSEHSITGGGRTFTVDPSRRLNFKSAKFLMLRKPEWGVIGGNRFWVGKARGVGAVHIQAPQFLASKEFGHPIHQVLIPDVASSKFPKPTPFTANTLLLIASIPRDAREHARIVYGYNMDLVYGKYIEEMTESDDDASTPYQTEDEDYDAFLERKRAYDTRPQLVLP